MITLDNLRDRFPDRGFAVYAYEPGKPVTVEMMWPDGSRFDATGATEEEAILSLCPDLALQWFPSPPSEQESVPDETDLFG